MLGVLSLIFWSLLIVVTLKYVVVILRADNAGEGGILSLVALVQQKLGTTSRWARRAVALGVLGAALFYCDALITPAISVLSAVEGLELLEPELAARRAAGHARRSSSALFAIQRRGTAARRAACSARSWCVWFVALGVLGVRRDRARRRRCWRRVNPRYALRAARHAPGPGAGDPRRRVPRA